MQPILKRKAAVPEIQSVDQAVAFLCVLNQMMLGPTGQIDNFISPLLIQFFLRMASEKNRVRRPGRIK